MAVSTQTVLVFGATGVVGRAAASEACRRGAKVWLAMRDPTKMLEGLTTENPEVGRVKADLSQPASLKRAVEQSGATSAFVYTIHESDDHMRTAFEALKEAGIKFVVLLSSFWVQGSAREKSNLNDFITRVHAQAEIALEETGIRHAAVRPGYFDSNLSWYASEIQQGEVQLLYPTSRLDYVAPEDIGTVCGALLAEPPVIDGRETAKTMVNLCGPELLSQREAFEIVSLSTTRHFKLKEIDEAGYYEKLKFIPEPIIRATVIHLRQGDETYPRELYEEGVATLRKYLGREPTKLADWIETHKEIFG